MDDYAYPTGVSETLIHTTGMNPNHVESETADPTKHILSDSISRRFEKQD